MTRRLGAAKAETGETEAEGEAEEFRVWDIRLINKCHSFFSKTRGYS
jgi:hypothetical protein